MFSKHKELNVLEAMMVAQGSTEEEVRSLMELLDVVYDAGFKDGYKRGRQDEILSQMMGDTDIH